CEKWTYDRTYFQETLTTKWNLVCDKAVILRTMLAVISFGTMFSSINTYIMDIGCLSIFAFDEIYWTIFKFVNCTVFLRDICYCWSLEFVHIDKRAFVTTCFSVSFSVASASLSLIAYFCSTWFQMALCTTCPSIILLVFAVLPESPRWLFRRGRYEEAARSLAKMAALGGQAGYLKADDILHCFKEAGVFGAEKRSEVSRSALKDFADFVKSANMRKKAMALTFIFAFGNQIYCAIPFVMEKLEADFYISFAVQSLVEVPAALTLNFVMGNYGRVLPLSLAYFTAATFCLLTWPLTSLGPVWPLISIGLAHFFAAVGVNVSFQFLNESYPTIGRGVGMGLAFVALSLANFSFQYTILLANVWQHLPKIVFSILVYSASLVALFLPDVGHQSLPATVAEAEAQGSFGTDSFAVNLKNLPSALRKRPKLNP
uniref:Major facilitator superfamily (MFS) profile domain-containing protein n=1 Tax=Romanomermis culicivorax TaxID=13658 RepID=A0A915HSN3_ROMCU